MQQAKLTTKELMCLRAVVTIESPRASRIAAAIGTSPPHVSRVVASLEDKGFLTTKKNGLSRIVALSETKHATLLRRLVLEFGHMSFEELLSGTSLEVLSAICNLALMSRKEIAQAALVSEASVALVLIKLKRVGVVQKAGVTYDVSPRFQTLRGFVVEFRHYLNQRTAREFASDAVVLWECNSEFIIETKTAHAKDGFQLTGVSSFARFGISLLAPKSYFFYSPFPRTRKLRLEDVVLHSVLAPNTSLLPVLLVWKKQEKTMRIEYLEAQAEKYRATEIVRKIVTYFRTEGRERGADFPTWDEFVLRAKEYGILLVPQIM